jgi:hypothetical protein
VQRGRFARQRVQRVLELLVVELVEKERVLLRAWIDDTAAAFGLVERRNRLAAGLSNRSTGAVSSAEAATSRNGA